MWKFDYETETDVSIDKLWNVMGDIERWHTWDNEIQYCKLHGKVAKGESYTMKPKFAPKVKMTIEEHQAPNLHVDLTHLPLGRMRIQHIFTQKGDKTVIQIKVEIWGALGFLWQKFIGEKVASGMEANVNAFIRAADIR
jgi:hypothetical protein